MSLVISAYMDGFSYKNIFETKGIEYIIIISFLLLVIPFWLFINKKKSGVKIDANEALTFGSLKILKGLYFSKYHTWAFLPKSGLALVGLDDFIQRITGEVKVRFLINEGDIIKKGDLMAEMENNGKILRLHSPVSGTIVKSNRQLYSHPELINEDPYGKGWIYSIKPSAWIEETRSFYLADSAADWVSSELNRFRDFLSVSMSKGSPVSAQVIMQDGGELCNNPLSELPAEVWTNFQNSFLD
jgi:glycine cleavage system H protein